MCAALLLLASSCASDTVPGEAGPDFTGERVGAVEPSTVSTDTVAAGATIAPMPDPDSSPPPPTSAPPPIEPVIPEATAEEPAATSDLASQDIEDPPLLADSDSGITPIDEHQPEDEPGPEEPQTEDEPGSASEEPQPEELPGGGLVLFEPGDEGPARRLVAAYGHPSTPGLGVLGEQKPEEAVERLQAIAEGYGADGSSILPTFEIIATVASASAGGDGDYSRETGLEAIRPWIETAAANGMYVVLDLQPGRSDFLSQAMLYEEFLRLPHVGLALDPEWRLEPHQVHLRQVGTVDAAEINQVVDWLAEIVREEALPQKLLIVHQFRFSMITNRELIETRPELAVMIHMDGQGSLSDKYNTWNALTGQADAERFYWGWKNFYDEDSPMATPEQVLELSPNIVYVSFQ